MSIFAVKILSRLIQSTIGDLDRIPKSNEILTMPVEAQKSFQNFWVNFDCTFIDISIRHWSKSTKLTNFNHSDYLEIAKCSALQRLPDDEITAIAERNLEIYDKL